MTPHPELTVIMPVYNGSKYLREAIDSILSQSYQNFEFLIIDDGSKDDSLEIVESYKKRDSRIKLIKNIKNMGIVSSLNTGLEQSKGEFIARMDADDISEINRFSIQLDVLKKFNADICGCHWKVINENGKTLSANLVPLDNYSFTTYLANGIVPFAHGSVIIRKKFLLLNDLKYLKNKYAEDYFLWSEFYKNNGIFINCDDFLFKYRDYGLSLSKIKFKENLLENKLIRNIFINDNRLKIKEAVDVQIDNINNLTYMERVNLLCLVFNKFGRSRGLKEILSICKKLTYLEVAHAIIRNLKR